MLGMVTPVGSMIFKHFCYLTFNPNQLLINSLKKRTSQDLASYPGMFFATDYHIRKKGSLQPVHAVLSIKCQCFSLTFSFQ